MDNTPVIFNLFMTNVIMSNLFFKKEKIKTEKLENIRKESSSLKIVDIKKNRLNFLNCMEKTAETMPLFDNEGNTCYGE